MRVAEADETLPAANTSSEGALPVSCNGRGLHYLVQQQGVPKGALYKHR
jgi:hypothetical protein